jgi:hypothetical protein
MNDCECAFECLFFNDKMMRKPTVTEMMKNGYCHNTYVDCARYIVNTKLGASKVPSDLYPYEKARAFEIVEHATDGKSKV